MYKGILGTNTDIVNLLNSSIECLVEYQGFVLHGEVRVLNHEWMRTEIIQLDLENLGNI